MKLSSEEAKELLRRLKEIGAKEEPPPEYASYRLRLKGGELTVYESGSLVYSGKGREEVKETVIEELLSMERKLPIVGCDEAGKGEFVGPLVVACVCADRDCLRELLRLEVKDSKRLKGERVVELSDAIKAKCRGIFRVIMPERYNREYEKFKNLNRYLEEIYLDILKKLLKKCSAKRVVVDKFSSRVESFLKEKLKGVEVVAVEEGEREAAVAAASVVAKAERLKALKRLSKEFGLNLEEGNAKNREILERVPKGELHRLVKLHFKVEGMR